MRNTEPDCALYPQCQRGDVVSPLLSARSDDTAGLRGEEGTIQLRLPCLVFGPCDQWGHLSLFV